MRWLLRVASIVALVYGAGYVTLRVSGTVMVTDEHSFPGHTGHVAVSINGSGIVEALRAAGVSESVIFTVYWPLVELECRGRDAFSSR